MTALIYSENYDNHETGNNPENKERIRVIMNSVRQTDIISQNHILEPEMASEKDILRVHSPEYVNKIREFCQAGGGYLDYDTFASPLTYQTAKLAVGGAIKAVELVLNGEDNAYSIGRPPGHHATRNKAMGFCIFNNLAITIEYLRKVHGVKKFLVFDFDVHYGNGVAEMFYDDPQVLYISIHQDPRTIFPGTGVIEEMGEGEGEGFNLNIPLPPGSTTSDYTYILERVLRPVAEDFDADFYLVDVGFDGHRDDPLSNMKLDDYFYEWIGVEMMSITKNLVLILEGGYDLNVLRRCNLKLINSIKKDNLTEKNFKKHELMNLKAKQETENIFMEIKEVFSPFFKFE